MKKVLLVVLIICVLFTALACKESNGDNNTTSNNGQSTTSTTNDSTSTSQDDQTAPTPDVTRTPSEGLEFEPVTDKVIIQVYGESYAVTGIGTCTDKNIVIPDTYNGLPVTMICNIAFFECRFIETVYIPDSVVSLDYVPFAFCSSIIRFEVSDAHPCFFTIDGNIYYKQSEYFPDQGMIFVQYALGKKDKNFTIPEGITHIYPGAFLTAENLETIIVPDGVTYIEYASFASCASLKSLTLPSSVEYLGPAILEESVNIERIIFNGTVEQWNAIEKDISWTLGTGEFVIYCTNGSIAKDGTIIN